MPYYWLTKRLLSSFQEYITTNPYMKPKHARISIKPHQHLVN